MSNEKTHFGYKDVDVDQKAKLVRDVFSSVASKYDLMNDLMSGGMHRLWKRFAIDLLDVRPGMQILDLAGGTGDLTQLIYKKLFHANSSATGQIVLADINYDMLDVGRDKLIDSGMFTHTKIIQVNAEALAFNDNTFDRMIIGFGLRNVTDKGKALASMYNALKPGGKCLVLEFSKPTNAPLSLMYDKYSFSILPWLGDKIANDRESYQYLAESIRKHPNQADLRMLMLESGFDNVHHHNLTGGIVAVHVGVKY